jgi:hypothetical protein
VDIVGPLILSGSAVLVAAVAFYNRDNPAWRRDMRVIYVIAFGQVALGAVTWILLSLRRR